MATNPLHNPEQAIRQLAKKWRGPALQRPLWSIIDWPLHFENSHTRKLARLPFVLLPTKHDGKSYRRLMRHDQNGNIFACWVLIAELAAKSAARGYLADEDGPYTPLDMADMTGMSAEAFTLALDFLASDEIRWLEKTTADSIPSSPDRSGDSPEYIPHPPEDGAKINDLHKPEDSPDNLPTTQENAGAREEKRREEKEREENPPIVPKGDNTNPVTSLTEAAEKKEGGVPKPHTVAIEAAVRIRKLFGAERAIGTIAFGSLIEHVNQGALPADEKKWAALAAMKKARDQAGSELPKDLRYDWLMNMEKLAEKLPIAFDLAVGRFGTPSASTPEKKDAPPGWQAAARAIGFEATDWTTLPTTAKAAIRRQLAEAAA